MGDVHDPTLERALARVGTTLREKWRIDALLGVGGMAAVYAATHRNGKRAAVKVLHSMLSLDANVRGRFVREGHVANKVGHPGAVSVIDDDVAEDGSVFLVMDLLEGETLADRAERCGKLEAGEVLSAIDQLLDVLAAAHAVGIIHRDIKPENVFVTRDGQIKVLDFGIARLRELSTASTATQQGSTMGTPAFMPPEQARGLWDHVDAQTDVWAVGATAFTLLTGLLVHEARTPNEQLLAAMTAQARPLADVAPGLPQHVNDLVDRALAFDKKDRWLDARAMQSAVRVAYQVMIGNPITTAPKLVVPLAIDIDTAPTIRLAPNGGSVTGDAVVSGRTGVDGSPRRSAPRPLLIALLAATGLLTVGVVAGAIALIGSIGAEAVSASSTLAPTADAPTISVVDAGSDSTDEASTSVAFDELPIAASSESSSHPKSPKIPSPVRPPLPPPATIPVPPAATTVVTPADTRDIMDKRR
jgi:serine/threonine-protein kinase